jgi:hypothetical protein
LARARDPAALTQVTAALDLLTTLAFSEWQVGTTLQPALYLQNNDITLAATAPAISSASLPGLLAICTEAAIAGSLFFQGNRVEVPTTGSIAMVSLWSARTVVTGNQFYQLQTQSVPSMPCVLCIADSGDNSGALAVMVNIVHPSWLIYPVRGTASPNTWEFLNTVG